MSLSTMESAAGPLAFKIYQYEDNDEKNCKFEHVVKEHSSNSNNSHDTNMAQQVTTTKGGQQQLFSIRKVLQQLLLPIGYPDSVEDTYMAYQFYDSVQGLSSYLRGVVATSAVLQAMGVGDSQSSVFSATVTWILRDGVGMIFGLLFSYILSDCLDIYVQEFRLVADISNDVALTLDLYAPQFSPKITVYILAVSTICKTICGIAAGSTKGRITQHFAKYGNLADLNAKESTQETLMSLIGMIGGMALIHILEYLNDSAISALIFHSLTILHVYANYKGVQLLKFSTINPQRMNAIIWPLIKWQHGRNTTKTRNITELTIKDISDLIITPKQVSTSIWLSLKDFSVPSILVNANISQINYEWTEFQSSMYVIGKRKNNNSSFIKGINNNQIGVALRLNATPRDEIMAYTHAILLQQYNCHWNDKVFQDVRAQIKQLFAGDDGNNNFDLYQALIYKGWNIEQRVYLGFSSSSFQRYDWAPLGTAQHSDSSYNDDDNKNDNNIYKKDR